MAKKHKHTKGKRKIAGRGNPISLYIRGKITAQAYWALIGMSVRA